MSSNFVTKSSLLLALAARFRLGGLLRRRFGRLLRGLGLRLGLCLALGRPGLGMFGVLSRGGCGGDRLRLGLGPCGLGRLCPVGEDFGHAHERKFLPVPRFLREFFRRRFLKAMIFGPRPCSRTSAATEAPAMVGWPRVTLSPPTTKTSPNCTISPGEPLTLSTLSTSSAATRYCLPPVLMTANIVLVLVFVAGAPISPDRLLSVGCGLCGRQSP